MAGHAFVGLALHRFAEIARRVDPKFPVRQEQGQARWQDTLMAMESVARGQVVSGQAVHEWLGSWGTTDELMPPKAGQ